MDRSLLTLNQLFYNSLKHNGDKPAVRFQDQELTYNQLLKAGNRVARALRKHGVGPNVPVALMMSNCLEFVVSDMGLNLAGGTKIPLNDMLGEKEIKYILQDSGAKVAFVGPNFIDIVSRIKEELPQLESIVAVLGDDQCPEGMISWSAFQAAESEEDVRVEVFPQDRALIAYTGGTTGLPKGVVHSQENIVINLFSHAIELELRENEKILLMSPLPHSAGMLLHAGILKGALHFIEKGFDPQLVLDRIEQDKVTVTFMVPTMIYRVMDQMENRKYDFLSLQTILYGAAPITESRLKQGLEIFGPVFTQLYGQTEAPNFISRLKKSDHILSGDKAKRLRSCGQPVAMSQVRIVDENGNEVPALVEGEITAKTPYNMIGYHNQPEKTEETIKGGWLHTGDVGMKDEDGYIYLFDRKKDMIISGGMNVYTTEVENVIQRHPDTAQVAVIGVPHPDWGEAVMAVIVPKLNTTPTAESVLELCRQELSKYKRPKEIRFVEALPLTPYGKIDKKELRKPFWEGIGRNI
jgi:fatty-acyl-CoA synthase